MARRFPKRWGTALATCRGAALATSALARNLQYHAGVAKEQKLSMGAVVWRVVMAIVALWLVWWMLRVFVL